MSGIYIPGMEMQENCFGCPLNRLNRDGGFFEWFCGFTKSNCRWDKLPDDCPLIPVPEHGRSIDADALKLDLTRFYDGEVTAKRLIDEQPTIIPADKEE